MMDGIVERALETDHGRAASGDQDGGATAGGVMKSYFRVFRYADSVCWTLNVIALFCAVAAGTLLPLMDIVFGKFVTVFNDFVMGRKTPEQFRADLRWWTLWFVYLFMAKFILTYIWTMAISISAIRTTKALRIKFLESTLRQDMGYFDREDSGSIAIQVTTNGSHVTNGISDKLGLAVQSCTTFFASFVVAFVVQWKLTLIAICVVPVIIIVTVVCVTIDANHEAQIQPIYSRAGAFAQEVFTSMKTVQAFWTQPRFAAKYDGFLTQAEKIGAKKSPNLGVWFSTEYFCIFAGYGLAFWQGVKRYASGEISQPGTIVTVIFAVILAATSLTQIFPQTLNISKAASAADELFKTIDRESKIDVFSEKGITPHSCRGDIEISSVHFAYPSRPTTPVLKGMSLKIPANKTTALVGASGCGKSTVVGLLSRWYTPALGSLRLDGIELSQLNLKWLRTQIRVVQQEPVLFRGSVFENVAYGLEGSQSSTLSSDQKMKLVELACKDAYAHEFITQLPEGYQTILDERATTLSGGQKQRIAIARSIIAQPRILLLDEATSGLDAKSERIVQEALDRVSANRTTLIIAHRLSTGTHEELIARGGAYARLVNAQDLGEHFAQYDSLKDSESKELANMVTNEWRDIGPTKAENPTAVKEEKQDHSLLYCVWVLLGEKRQLWPQICILSVACVFAGFTYPAQAIVFSRVMSAFSLPTHEMVKQGDRFALLFFIIALANFLLYFVCGWFCNTISQVTIRSFRLEIFSGFLRQDMVFFDRPENSAGSLVSKLSDYPTNLQELFGFNLALILVIVVNLVSSCILALIVGWKLGLAVVFGALPPMVFSGYLRVRLELALDDATFQRFADSASLAAEAVGAIKTVASFTLERYVLDKYRENLREIEQKSVKSLLWTMFWYSMTLSISFLAMALGFWYGGVLISKGQYSTNQFFVVFIAVIFASEAAGQFFSFTTSFTKAQSAGNFLLRLRKMHPLIAESEPARDEEDFDSNSPASLSCNDLQFSYPLRPNRPVLRGLSINIPSGQTTAIVGPSGSGKTSIVTLLERFYDPTSGTISIDDHLITTLCPRRYRSRIGLVQQEPTLYGGSISENISLGLESQASQVQIESACRDANIYDFIISLPDGFSTICGTNGAQLSGGQKQRIAIARALIRKPRLLLLDEATSALDTESERVVQAALERAAKGRTTVAIAHRLSTIKGADRIIVVSRGEIVESGSHDGLREKRGLYYEMCLAQALDG